MDTKQKAEAYDKLLIKAKQIYNKENDVLIIHTIEDLFPELVESGDEKVRKHLISLVKNWDKDGIASKYTSDPNDIKQILTWLEKQGKPIDEEKVLIGARKDVALSIMNFLDKNTLGMCLSNMECEDLEDAVVNSDWSKIYDYMKKKLEKQNEQKPYGQRKECSDCQFNYAGKCKGSCQMKRNEQKPTNKVEPKFKVGDYVVNNETSNLCHIFKIEYGQYICDDCSFPITKENEYHFWTIQDAKEGDVIINWNNTVFIFKAIEDETVKFYIAYNEKWDTIKTPSTKLSHLGLPEPQFEFHPATKEQRDLLFQKMREAGYEWDVEKKKLKKIVVPIFNIGDTIVKKHNSDINDFGYFTITDITGGKYWYNARIICDITKQDEWSIYEPVRQKSVKWSKENEEVNGEDYGIDGLWHAMNILEKTLGKVSGYQSDDGILEHKCAITAVKKLYKQKPAWSEEDKWMIQTICHAFEKGSSQYIWLKSLKDRVLPQPKQEWSEEDKVRIEQICDDLECGLENFRSRKNVKGLHFEEIIKSNIDWLKSLKDRYIWKPSKEQLKSLKEVIDVGHFTSYPNALETLYEQLKKLREE